ncbi:MAG: hypothetical protein QM216_00295, partial [Bacillota bacterium]|nr:hypothetical protein [Bacillota bacterium]
FKFESQFGSSFLYLVLPGILQSLTRAPLFHCSIFKVRSLSRQRGARLEYHQYLLMSTYRREMLHDYDLSA